MRKILLLSVLFAFFALAGCSKDDGSQADMNKFTAKWTVYQVGGEAVSDTTLAFKTDGTFEIKGSSLDFKGRYRAEDEKTINIYHDGAPYGTVKVDKYYTEKEEVDETSVTTTYADFTYSIFANTELGADAASYTLMCRK